MAKVGAILDALAEHDSLKAPEIAALIDEPLSSVYRLLRALKKLGYLESPRRGVFRLGLRVFELGATVGSRFDIRRAAIPPMTRLHEETGETVLLFVRRGDHAVCIERLDGRWVRLEIVDVGESLPLHTGASPRTLLAYLSDEEVDEYLENARLEQNTPRSPSTPRQVRKLLEEVRSSGYCISDQDLALGVATVAAPIRDHSGAVVAAISYSGIAETLLGGKSRQRSIRVTAEAASEASRRLGWSGEGQQSVSVTNEDGSRRPASEAVDR